MLSYASYIITIMMTVGTLQCYSDVIRLCVYDTAQVSANSKYTIILYTHNQYT